MAQMFTDKLTARVVGVLFIVASVTAIVGGSLVGDSDALGDLVGVQHRVITGVLIELVLVVSVVGIAVLAFPVLRRRDESLALGYVAVRTLEAVALLAASIAAVVAVALSDDEAQAVAGGERVDDLVVATREWAYLMGSIVLFGVGALILYSVLYRAQLVPSWLSLWGLLGAVLLLARGVLELYGVNLSAAVQGVLTAPIGINEMMLAVWLIIKGFDGRVVSASRHRALSPADVEVSSTIPADAMTAR
jgi:hypothetical protein